MSLYLYQSVLRSHSPLPALRLCRFLRPLSATKSLGSVEKPFVDAKLSGLAGAEADVSERPVPDGQIDEKDMVEMWNKEAPAGPEWGGPRDGEPTKFGDWAKRGRVSDF